MQRLRRLAYGKALSVSEELNPHPQTEKVSCLFHSNASEAVLGFAKRYTAGRNAEEVLASGRCAKEFPPSSWAAKEFLGIWKVSTASRNVEDAVLGFPEGTTSGMHALRFCKGATSGKTAEAALMLGSSVLALWLNAEISHAEDQVSQDTGLPQQPEAKSNLHTARWRIFTDKARNLYAQGSYDEAEKFFLKALEEAKKGFGDQDPHVASCYNNLAELFRMKKEYNKAEPLYLEAVNRLRQSSGVEDGSVGFALHNLAGFYLLQRKLEQAQECYEEALKIKGRALGLDHPEYATTMFHLGEVIRLRGNVNDGVALMKDSIRILEQIGLGNTTVAVKRLSRLSEILVFSGQLGEAEAIQRKIVQVLEFSKDSTSLDIVSALESLIITLQRQGKLDECEGLLERCIDILRKNYGVSDIRVAASLSKLGGMIFQRGKKAASHDKSVALVSYEKAQELLVEAVRIAELRWKEVCTVRRKDSVKTSTIPASHYPLLLVRSLTTLGDLGICKLDLMADDESSLKTHRDAEEVLQRAIALLEDGHVQQVLKSSLDVEKLRMECAQHLVELHNRMNKIQSQR